MKTIYGKVAASLLCLLVFVQFVGCGYLLYPERRGQKSGELDVNIVALDAVCLLLFILPGVVAFAVDYTNGTIYLPKGSKRGSLEGQEFNKFSFDPKHDPDAAIVRIIREQTGVTVRLDQVNMQVVRLSSLKDMREHFSRVLTSLSKTQVASAKIR